jgi:hypothetical protein
MSMTTSATTTRMALLVTAMTFALASAAQAASARAFVASIGNDSNTSFGCTQADPCRSFMAAYGITASGGEIVALDSGGYGEVTITGPVSIIAAQVASVTVGASSIGITITAGASDVVVLKNLDITGNGAANTTGILVNSGRLILQNSTLKMLTTGLNIQSTVHADVVSSDIIGNTTGISTTGTGANTANFPYTGPTLVRIFLGNVLDNTTAYLMNDPGFAQGANFITVLLFSTGTVMTNESNNATLVAGSGASCSGGGACTNVQVYNPSYQNGGNNN